jgi:hypothetical protein
MDNFACPSWSAACRVQPTGVRMDRLAGAYKNLTRGVVALRFEGAGEV